MMSTVRKPFLLMFRPARPSFAIVFIMWDKGSKTKTSESYYAISKAVVTQGIYCLWHLV